MSEVPCPNCRKTGEPYVTSKYKHYCDDEACPVLSYDWNGKYLDESDTGGGSDE